jgi:DNA-binding NtrC family response regulator
VETVQFSSTNWKGLQTKKAAMSARAQNASHAEPRRSRILIVDEDAQVRELVSEILRGDEYEVFFEKQPEQLITSLSGITAYYEVILMDLCHPVDKILDLIPVVKEMFPNTEIVLISRLAEEDLWIESIQRGAYDYLPKPLDKSELRRVVHNAVENNRSCL